ncbi:unnamed protein product [Triticum turgidum subsp. durum]|uniref:non-specific serine/threonine protein kinase n=1 Tax=Triticum turgidum subsp. durum TaxID=4567 RepID=A0A9R0W6D0_TRITD|nr:unnamed protein product [Triticum turgidum subsp. durum]
MAALPCFRFVFLRLATLVAMLVQQARLVPVAMAQANNLTAGDALTPPRYITSPSGGFAFGFRTLDSDPTKFVLATWFRFADDANSSQPQPQSVVWFLKKTTMGTAVVATATSVLNITGDGRLRLTDRGDQELWSATTGMQRGSVLALSDSGNVQFLGDGDIVLWRASGTRRTRCSQGSPCPRVTRPGDSSSPSARTRSSGSLAVQIDGNVVLYLDLFTADYRTTNAYWATRTYGPNGNTTVTFDNQGFLNYTLRDGSVHGLISPKGSNGGNYLQLARMDPDGIVRTYTRPRYGSGGTPWTVSGALSGDGGCNRVTSSRQGLCGPGSYCVQTIDRLSCLCPTGYTYIDAQQTNIGCTPEFGPSASFCLFCLLLITIGGLVAQHYLIRTSDSQRPLNSGVRVFSWKELYQATNGFDSLLGKGSFGEVYKGTIRSPQPHLIAVKKLINSNEYSEQEFTNEVQSIGQIHHRNLVRMIGYCKEGRHRMLVFEFMPGGSLRSVLIVDQERRPQWCWRAEAALAITRGLEYLHDGCSAPIIHCDIKPDNILLDDRGVPRITDFGISKLLGSQQVHTTVTNVRGTRGYIAPEWLRSDARVDTKADVYSFGVVLLELICCRRCQERVVHDRLSADAGDDDETVTLFGWAAQLVVARRTELMLDGDPDVETVGDKQRVEQFARVALWCMEPNPLLRPTMHQVVQMLETRNQAQIQALPDRPDCYIESSPLIPQLKIE